MTAISTDGNNNTAEDVIKYRLIHSHTGLAQILESRKLKFCRGFFINNAEKGGFLKIRGARREDPSEKSQLVKFETILLC